MTNNPNSKLDKSHPLRDMIEVQPEEAYSPASGPASWERQVDMNGDVYIRENEDYLDRD
jgi:hypothetical protein